MYQFLVFIFIFIIILLIKERLYNSGGLKKTDYKEYINSIAWKNKAKKIRRRDGFVCRLCNAKNKELHVHHSTYQRLGRELDNDLITLCAPCHRKFHNK